MLTKGKKGKIFENLGKNMFEIGLVIACDYHTQ